MDQKAKETILAAMAGYTGAPHGMAECLENSLDVAGSAVDFLIYRFRSSRTSLEVGDTHKRRRTSLEPGVSGCTGPPDVAGSRSCWMHRRGRLEAGVARWRLKKPCCSGRYQLWVLQLSNYECFPQLSAVPDVRISWSSISQKLFCITYECSQLSTEKWLM